jgi:hypothetical protein
MPHHLGAAMKSFPVTVILASSAAHRVGRLIRLLGSDQPGEVVSAAAALERTLVTAGTDLHRLADIAEKRLVKQEPRSLPPRRPAPPRPPADDSDVAAMVRFCAFPGNTMSERDRAFIQSLERLVWQFGSRFDVSDKQKIWLLSIYQRLRTQQP